MSPTLATQLVAYLLPVITLFGPGILKRDNLTAEQNGWTSIAVIVVLSGVQAYAAGKLGVNPYVDFVAVTGGVTGLLAGPLNWLDQYLQTNIGVKPKPVPVTPVPVTPPASASEDLTFTEPDSGLPPTPIILPNTKGASTQSPPTNSPQTKQ